MADSSSGLGTAAAGGPAPVVVNGAPRAVRDGTALPALLEELGLRVGTVVIEHNGVALTRAEARAAVLRGGDTLEIVRAVAGG
jgi:sulfur carrier protein